MSKNIYLNASKILKVFIVKNITFELLYCSFENAIEWQYPKIYVSSKIFKILPVIIFIIKNITFELLYCSFENAIEEQYPKICVSLKIFKILPVII